MDWLGTPQQLTARLVEREIAEMNGHGASPIAWRGSDYRLPPNHWQSAFSGTSPECFQKFGRIFTPPQPTFSATDLKEKGMSLRFGIFAVLICSGALGQQFGPWSAPVNLGQTINSAYDDMHPTLSKDGLTMVFSSIRPGGAGKIDLWVTERDSVDSPWQAPQDLTMLNSPFDDHAPSLTSNGHWLFFYSTRPGGCNENGRTELWAAHRQNKRDDFGWDPPFNLGCTLNITGADEGAPSFWSDDETGTLYLYFARNLTPANGNGLDIFVTTCASDLDNCNRQGLW